MPPTVTPLANGRRVPIPYPDEDGIPCLRVPLDDGGKNFALIEREDYDYIVLTLNFRAAWFLAGSRGRRQYVQVNAPKIDGKGGGVFHVARLLPGVESQRVQYVTSETWDLRRSNLAYKAGDERTRRHLGSLVAQASKGPKPGGKP